MTVKEYLSQAYRIDQRINSKLEQVASLRALATKATYTLSDTPPSGSRNVQSMDDSTWRTFKEDYSVRRLEVRFDLENLFVTYGKSPRCREFFRILNFLMDVKEVS